LIPAWVDRREYPFEPRTLDVDGGRLSYVDEGDGAPVVMVHGTPTWSFLYRHCGHAPPEERAPEALERLAPFLERSGGEG
jgi:hypothetical protein